MCVFFFQAEDGIRDIGVTGVQTCALPIYPKQSFTDYGFLVAPGAYEAILNTDSVSFGGNGFADDSVVHFTIADPLYKKEKKEWLKLYIPARTAVVLRKKK